MKPLLFILCIAEVLLYTWLRDIAGDIVSPLLFLGVSVAIAVVFLKLADRREGETVGNVKYLTTVRITSVVLFTALSAIIAVSLGASFGRVHISPNDTSASDVIPTMMHMVKNFIAGQSPYYKIQFATYSTTPSYLPFQWMPYIAAERFNFDYRWMAVLSTWLACLYFFIKNFPSGSDSYSTALRLILPIWPLLVYLALTKYYAFEFTITVESMVAGYYLLLATALDKQKLWAIAIAIPMCLLSRMSIVLWVPLLGVAWFASGNRKQLIIIITVCALFFLGFYWYPFLRNNPAGFANPYQSYTYVTEKIWERHALINGMGFNSWALKYLPGNIATQVAAYIKLHLVLCSLTVARLTGYYLIKRKKYALHTYLLFSLKIYLAVFYSFIQLPFTYLYIVPVMVSGALLTGAIVKRQGSAAK